MRRTEYGEGYNIVLPQASAARATRRPTGVGRFCLDSQRAMACRDDDTGENKQERMGE